MRLEDAAPELARALGRPIIRTGPRFDMTGVHCRTVMVPMRDGVRLATDIYLPPVQPAPTIVVRTPYGRGADGLVGALMAFARRGYAVISQDCRGTGASEPNSWDYYVYEPEDSYDLIEWVAKQVWYSGFVGSCGGSYLGQTQWQMALHPCMSTIVPEVSGLGVAVNTVRHHMFSSAYARSVGKGEGKVSIPLYDLEAQMLGETLSSGFFNAPLQRPFPDRVLASFPHLATLPYADGKRWLWEHYCSLSCAQRAEFIRRALDVKYVTSLDIDSLSAIFGQEISHDRHTLPRTELEELCGSFHAPAMLCTGWYDWGLNDALATWQLLMRTGTERVRSRSRLFISPAAHNAPGYHEGQGGHPELRHAFRTETNVELLLQWYSQVQADSVESWPRVIYYLMGANEWRTADAWPIPAADTMPLYLGRAGALGTRKPHGAGDHDSYTYDPNDPTPTLGGSIVSYVYPPGSVDVGSVHRRRDVLVYTTEPLENDLDIVGPLKLVLYASSNVADTDFAARLSDVLPDDTAIQIQNGVLRTRFRTLPREPEMLEPGRVYRLEIDMWATANRFKAGHRLRLDISSADFPRFDRNANRGGAPGSPLPALQKVYYDADRPSHLLLPVLAGGGKKAL